MSESKGGKILGENATGLEGLFPTKNPEQQEAKYTRYEALLARLAAAVDPIERKNISAELNDLASDLGKGDPSIQQYLQERVQIVSIGLGLADKMNPAFVEAQKKEERQQEAEREESKKTEEQQSIITKDEKGNATLADTVIQAVVAVVQNKKSVAEALETKALIEIGNAVTYQVKNPEAQRVLESQGHQNTVAAMNGIQILPVVEVQLVKQLADKSEVNKTAWYEELEKDTARALQGAANIVKRNEFLKSLDHSGLELGKADNFGVSPLNRLATIKNRAELLASRDKYFEAADLGADLESLFALDSRDQNLAEQEGKNLRDHGVKLEASPSFITKLAGKLALLRVDPQNQEKGGRE